MTLLDFGIFNMNLKINLEKPVNARDTSFLRISSIYFLLGFSSRKNMGQRL
jgi:hypothetical protein